MSDNILNKDDYNRIYGIKLFLKAELMFAMTANKNNMDPQKPSEEYDIFETSKKYALWCDLMKLLGMGLVKANSDKKVIEFNEDSSIIQSLITDNNRDMVFDFFEDLISKFDEYKKTVTYDVFLLSRKIEFPESGIYFFKYIQEHSEDYIQVIKKINESLENADNLYEWPQNIWELSDEDSDSSEGEDCFNEWRAKMFLKSKVCKEIVDWMKANSDEPTYHTAKYCKNTKDTIISDALGILRKLDKSEW
jgi:hypothetical protein